MCFSLLDEILKFVERSYFMQTITVQSVANGANGKKKV
jgi:hypothetical protein